MASEYDVLLEEPKTAVSGTPSEYDALLEEPAAPTAEKAQPWYYPKAGIEAGKSIVQGFRNIGNEPTQEQAPTEFEQAGQRVGRVAGAVMNIPGQALQLIPGVKQLGQAVGGMFSRTPIPGTQGTGADLAQGIQYEAQQHPRLMANLGAVANIAGVLPVGRMVSGAADAIKAADLGGMAPKVSPTALDKAIQKGVDKGIKPTVVGKPSFAKLDEFYDKANDAVKTIAENKNALKLVDENGEAIPRPRSAAEMAQAITQTKKIIYDKYHDMAVQAGDAGAQFDSQPVISKLDKIAQAPDEKLKPGDTRLKYAPEIRDYANSLKDEISELHGAPPDVIEARIADLNNSLKGFYEGRTSKAKAQVDGSVAQSMREELDNKIMSTQGEGYQDLKNQYGALKSVENEVSKRALVNARRATKGAFDLTDVFTGGELVGGLLTGNPLAVAKGATGMGIKTAWKALNDPDRYINGMFKKAWEYNQNPSTEGLKDLLSLKNRSGSIGGTDIVPPTESAKWQMINETMPENTAARTAAQEGHQKAAIAYEKAQSLLKNRPAIGGMSVLNKAEGQAIADKLGVRYNGIQPGYGKIAPYHMFTDLTPGQESTFLARNAEEAGLGLQKTRKLFQNRAGSIGGMEHEFSNNNLKNVKVDMSYGSGGYQTKSFRNAAETQNIIDNSRKELLNTGKYEKEEINQHPEVQEYLKTLKNKYGYEKTIDLGDFDKTYDIRDIVKKQGWTIEKEGIPETSAKYIGSFNGGPVKEIVIKKGNEKKYIYELPERNDVDSFNYKNIITTKKLYGDEYLELLHKAENQTSWGSNEEVSQIRGEYETLPQLKKRIKNDEMGGNYGAPDGKGLATPYWLMIEKPYVAEINENNFNQIKKLVIDDEAETTRRVLNESRGESGDTDKRISEIVKDKSAKWEKWFESMKPKLINSAEKIRNKSIENKSGNTPESQGSAPMRAGSIGGMENPQIHTDNFKKWFGDSKVVDENGKPLVVYHGTNKDFSVFDNEKSAQGVHWFSSDKSKIQKGKSGAASSKNIMPVYLNAKKLAGWKEYEKYSLGEIEKMGFDGIKLDDDYIVFNPSQIKSATGNSGAFDPKNSDIRGSAPMKMLGITAGISGAAGAAGMAIEYKKKKSIGNMKAKGK